MKKILVACGNGIATSTVVATKIREICKKEGIDVLVRQCKLLEVRGLMSDYDILVTTGKIDSEGINIPIITAMPLLTGIGEEEVMKKIISLCKS